MVTGEGMIRILYFAQLREMFNREQENVSLTESITTLADLRRVLGERGTRWITLMQNNKTLAAVNQQLAGDDCVLRAGDEVAFFQPVTGG
jgi:molybdopterin synthase sulfur carrier subunit